MADIADNRFVRVDLTKCCDFAVGFFPGAVRGFLFKRFRFRSSCEEVGADDVGSGRFRDMGALLHQGNHKLHSLSDSAGPSYPFSIAGILSSGIVWFSIIDIPGALYTLLVFDELSPA